MAARGAVLLEGVIGHAHATFGARIFREQVGRTLVGLDCRVVLLERPLRVAQAQVEVRALRRLFNRSTVGVGGASIVGVALLVVRLDANHLGIVATAGGDSLV